MVIQQASALDSETSTDTKTIFIVDDHPIMRQGLAVLINHEKDLNVCGEAEDAAHALDGILATKPDLALIDISLPGKNGLELIKDLRAMDVYVSILVHSMHDESLYVERVLRAGAQGYITKDEGGSKLMEAIRKVLAGEIYVSPEMSGKIIEIFSGRRASSTNPVEALTDRQFEIFQMIGNGQSTRDIAETLNVSIKTVDAHRDHIKKKLNLRSGTELVRFAVRWVESQN
ncbi:MAG: response regulator transcription factor [Verrucomicrobia bacterium]|nr:response regulator transcription factor [Verrucomicrobiota bacterium]